MLAGWHVVNPATAGPGCRCDQVLIQTKMMMMMDLRLSLDVQNEDKRPSIQWRH